MHTKNGFIWLYIETGGSSLVNAILKLVSIKCGEFFEYLLLLKKFRHGFTYAHHEPTGEWLCGCTNS